MHDPHEQAISLEKPPANDRREQVGWYFYDWAVSAFSTTVVTVFLGPYLTTVASAAADVSGYVYPFGIRVSPGAFYPYLVSLSVLQQVILLPILGAIADYSGRKKQMLALCAYTGALATLGMYFLEGSNYLLGGGLFLVANLCLGASMVFYNAFLPEIATPDRRDAVSSMGWATGYMGGGLLLAMNLVLFSSAGSLGLTQGHAVRISLASAGLWWAAFTPIPLLALKRRQPLRRMPPGRNYLTAGFQQLHQTLRNIRQYPQTVWFLVAFLLYNDGIQTVIALASQFGQEELGLSMSTLTTAILMVQFVAFFGALFFGRAARLFGAKRALIASIVIWTGTVIYSYGFLETSRDFYALAAVIGFVMGGSQALSRSLFSFMIPRGKESEYFSFYEVSERGTSWLGPLLFGLALQFTGSYRIAILSLVVFFILGLLLLCAVNVGKGAVEAGNEAPPKV